LDEADPEALQVLLVFASLSRPRRNLQRGVANDDRPALGRRRHRPQSISQALEPGSQAGHVPLITDRDIDIATRRAQHDIGGRRLEGRKRGKFLTLVEYEPSYRQAVGERLGGVFRLVLLESGPTTLQILAFEHELDAIHDVDAAGLDLLEPFGTLGDNLARSARRGLEQVVQKRRCLLRSYTRSAWLWFASA
jgi:hypothetical protein